MPPIFAAADYFTTVTIATILLPLLITKKQIQLCTCLNTAFKHRFDITPSQICFTNLILNTTTTTKYEFNNKN